MVGKVFSCRLSPQELLAAHTRWGWCRGGAGEVQGDPDCAGSAGWTWRAGTAGSAPCWPGWSTLSTGGGTLDIGTPGAWRRTGQRGHRGKRNAKETPEMKNYTQTLDAASSTNPPQ